MNAAEMVAELFVSRLETKKQDVSRIAAFGNSFEGWLKWELALGAAEEWGSRPWENRSEAARWETIGVEYTAPLQTRTANRLRKKIDLWVCPPPKFEKHVYVELKVAFRNGSRSKQFASAQEDLDCLQALTGAEREMLAGCLVLVVAVGFEPAELESADGEVHWIMHREGAGIDETPSIAVIGFVA